MYHGFDWYGRTLEVREVSSSSYNTSSCLPVCRTATLASAALVHSEVAFVVGSGGVSVVVGCEVD